MGIGSRLQWTGSGRLILRRHVQCATRRRFGCSPTCCVSPVEVSLKVSIPSLTRSSIPSGYTPGRGTAAWVFNPNLRFELAISTSLPSHFCSQVGRLGSWCVNVESRRIGDTWVGWRFGLELCFALPPSHSRGTTHFGTGEYSRANTLPRPCSGSRTQRA